MDKETTRQAIIDRHGPWTAHNIDLGDGVFTLEPNAGPDWTIKRAELALAMAQIFTRKPASAMRALDIGCLEGGMCVALGRHGVEVVGLEIRDEHLAKAVFARDALGLKNVTLVKGDMLKIAVLELGRFDLIICAGTLYHVDAPDLLPFLRSLERSCSGIAVFDTHVAREPREVFQVEGLEVIGRSIVEHGSTSSETDKASRLWASRHNDFAFWPTENGLVNLLAKAGFSTIFKPMHPTVEWPWKDRDCWVATSNSLLSWPAPISTLRSDPDVRAEHHPMLDDPWQATANPNTRQRG